MGTFDNRKAWIYSAVGHGLILAVSALAFVVTPHATTPPDSVAVDIISSDQLEHIVKGVETGDNKVKTPPAEKIAEPKKLDDAVGKIDKKQVVTTTAPEPVPVKPQPVEKKPEPPKPVAEKKDEPQKAEKKPEPPKIDPIAEALKKDDAKKPVPKQEAKAPPPKPVPQQPKERVFDQSKIAALLDKRDPSREAIAGSQINDQRALGKSTGLAVNNSATWGAMFKQQVERCWNKPYGGEIRQPMVSITVRLGKDGALQTAPKLEQPSSDPTVRAYQETAVRAMLQCQPYRLPPTMYEGEFGWNYFTADFVDESRG